jgi:hypothetical protein
MKLEINAIHEVGFWIPVAWRIGLDKLWTE